MVYRSSTVLICTGGLSYSACGTTGDGYAWLERMGHTLSVRRPALAPLTSSAEVCKALQGTTHDDVQVKVIPYDDYPKKLAKVRHEYRGGFLWTHFGCSGPTAMNVSRWVSDLENYRSCRLELDLLPEDSMDSLISWMKDGKSTSRSKQIKNFLQHKFSQRVADALLQAVGVLETLTMAEVSLQSINTLAQWMKRFPLPIHGTRGYAKAEVTAGGVKLSEVDFQTMQSKVCEGLFLAGEILDLDGPIGGYNFQAAWSTGHTAGLNL